MKIPKSYLYLFIRGVNYAQILYLLFLFVLGATLHARTLNLHQAVERAVNARTAQAQQQVSPKPQAVQKATPEENTWYGLPIISFAQYTRESQQAIQTQEKYNQLYTEFLNLINVQDLDFTAKQGVPNYAKALARTKYIYIGETHETPAVQQEIKKMITAIRKANPGKKILLATELLTVPHPLVNPLHIHGKDWLFGEPSNYGIAELADQLHLDTLALDDRVIQFQFTGAGPLTLAKVGERYVMAGLDNQSPFYDEEAAALVSYVGNTVNEIVLVLKNSLTSLLYLYYLMPAKAVQNYIAQLHADKAWPSWKQEMTKQFGPGNEEYTLLYSALAQDMGDSSLPADYLENIAKGLRFSITLQASAWGVLQRNYQWAKRIKAIEKNYDIVIVWGGQAHLDDSAYYPSVPTLLAHPQAVQIDFGPLDDSIDEETLKRYQAREEALKQQQLDYCSNIELSQQQAENFVDNCQGWEAIDFEKTYFIMNKEKGNAPLSAQEETLAQQMQQLVPGVPTEDSLKEYYSVYVK